MKIGVLLPLSLAFCCFSVAAGGADLAELHPGEKLFSRKNAWRATEPRQMKSREVLT